MENSGSGYFLTRPYLDKFLKSLSIIYEIVIFTAGSKEYGDWVCDTFDK